MLNAARLAYAVLMAPAFLIACTGPAVHRSQAGDSLSSMKSVDATAHDADVRRDLERVRAATRRFQDIAAAHAAGYPTTTPRCLHHPTAGAMGQHYVLRKLLDDQLDIEQPEILLYQPGTDGKQKLVAVEYIIPLSQWQSKEAPRIFGQSLKRSEELQLWYLHVWAWEENSAGLFADWNPAVKC